MFTGLSVSIYNRLSPDECHEFMVMCDDIKGWVSFRFPNMVTLHGTGREQDQFLAFC